MRLIRRLKLPAPAVMLLAFAVTSGVLSAVRDTGERQAKRSTVPTRIVSLTPSNTEILFALGLEDRVVGVTQYCNYPPAARKKPKVGDMNASLEKIVSLKPDLVLAHAFLNDHLTNRLKKLGVRVAALDPKSFSQLYADIRKVGRITGRSSQAESVVKKMAADVSTIRSETARSKPKKVLVVIQPNPLWAAGPQTFVDEMLGYSHASNVAHDARPGFNLFSAEVAVVRNPDVIIVSRREERDFIMKSSLWRQTNAVRRGAVYVVDGDLLLRSGPRLSKGLAQLARVIHPEAFR